MCDCKKVNTTKEGISQSVSIRDRERLCIDETECILKLRDTSS